MDTNLIAPHPFNSPLTNPYARKKVAEIVISKVQRLNAEGNSPNSLKRLCSVVFHLSAQVRALVSNNEDRNRPGQRADAQQARHHVHLVLTVLRIPLVPRGRLFT